MTASQVYKPALCYFVLISNIRCLRYSRKFPISDLKSPSANPTHQSPSPSPTHQSAPSSPIHQFPSSSPTNQSSSRAPAMSELLSCPMCSYVTAREEQLLRHVFQIHEHDPKFQVYCSACGRSFTKLESLRKHKYRSSGC